MCMLAYKMYRNQPVYSLLTVALIVLIALIVFLHTEVSQAIFLVEVEKMNAKVVVLLCGTTL